MPGSGGAMQRTPEPELMDDDAQALAYADADFEDSNSSFVRHFQGTFPEWEGSGTLLDLGCGPADIAARLAHAFPDCAVHAVDGSAAMLRCAEAVVARAGAADRVTLVLADAPLPRDDYDAVVSNSLLHHLPDPAILWGAIRRFARPGAPVFVMDLARPDSPQAARGVVDAYAAGEPDLLRRDFLLSLHASYSVDEVHAQLDAAGLSGLEVGMVSDRHLAVWGRA